MLDSPEEMRKERKRQYLKKWVRANRDRVNALNKKWKDKNREKDKDKTKSYMQKWATENKDKIKIYSKKSKTKNKDTIKISDRNWRDKNKDKVKAYNKKWRDKNKEKIKAYDAKRRGPKKEHVPYNKSVASKIWRENNHEKVKERRLKYALRRNHRAKQRRNTDVFFATVAGLRNSLNKALERSNTAKSISVTFLIGCSIPDFKTYLQSLFTEGMSWENRNEWHLDHKKPCASFDLSDMAQQKECFHHTNFQPLWKKDNLSKGSLYQGKRYTYN